MELKPPHVRITSLGRKPVRFTLGLAIQKIVTFWMWDASLPCAGDAYENFCERKSQTVRYQIDSKNVEVCECDSGIFEE